MKKMYFLAAFVSFTLLAHAQTPGEGTLQTPEKRQQDIEALKVAFISKELNLTPDEAQKFWPVYNQYAKELATVTQSNEEDVLERDEKVLNLRKKYKDQFSKILGAPRMNQLYGAESNFRKLLIRALKRQQGRRANPNRQLRRD